MKLPTLNIDVAVNTGNLKKQIADANKTLGGLAQRGASATGGMGGKLKLTAIATPTARRIGRRHGHGPRSIRHRRVIDCGGDSGAV